MNKIFKSKKVILLTCILSLITFFITITTIIILYNSHVKTLSSALIDVAEDEKSFITTLYDRNIALDSIIDIIQKYHLKSESFGKTGEIVIAKQTNDSIEFLSDQNIDGFKITNKIPYSINIAEPIRIALKGEKGYIYGIDYDNTPVYAGYTYIPELKWGIVAKIDASEVSQPYILIGILMLIIAFIFVLVGTYLFIRVTNPIIDEITLSENKFKTIFNNSGDSIIIADFDKIIYEVNETACKWLKYSKDELLKISYPDIHSNNIIPTLDAKYKIIKETGHLFAESEFINKDGKILYAEVNIKLINFNNKQLILNVIRDISERKEAERILQISIENSIFLADILDSSSQAFAVGFNDGRLGQFNNAFCELTGYSKDELLKIDWSNDLTAKEYIAVELNNLDQLIKTNKPVRYQKEYIHKNGSRIPAELYAHVVKDDNDNVKYYYAFINDISERIEAERKLNESYKHSKLLADILENSSQPFVIGYFDGRFEVVNKAYCDLTGYSKEELLSSKWTEIINTEKYLNKQIKLLLKVKETGLPERFQKEYIHKNGSTINVEMLVHGVRDEATLEIQYFYAFITDITERIEAEKKLHESYRNAQFLADIIENSSEAFAVGYIDGRIGIVNNAFCELVGYSKEEFTKIDWSKDIIQKKWADKQFQILQEIKENGTPQHFQKEYIHKNGSIIPVEMFIHGVKDDSGEIIYFYAFVTDITNRLEAERKIFEEKEKLSITLQSIGDAVISTDINGNIDIMNGVAEQLTGWKQIDAFNKPLTDVFNIVNEKTRIKCDNPVDIVMKTGMVVGLANHTALISKDGSEYIIADSGAAIRDNNNNIIGVVLVFRDETEKRRKDEALKKSEEKFSRSFKMSPDAVSISRFSDGVYLEINQSFTDITGYTSDEIIGHSAMEEDINIWVSNNDRFKLLNEIKEKNECSNFEAQFKRKDETVIHGIVSARRMEIDNEDCLISITRDITERILAERKIKENKHFIQKIFDSVPLLIYIFDIKSQKSIFSNREVTKNLGFTNEQTIAMGSSFVNNLLHPDDYDKVINHFSKFSNANDNDSFDVEYRIKHSDGTWHWLRSRDIVFLRDDDGNVTQLLGSNEDITERKKIEEKIIESEEKFRKLFEEAPLGIVMTNSNFRFINVNTAFCNMLGYSQEELLNMTIKDVTHPDHYSKNSENISKIISGDIKQYLTEKKYIHKNGSIVWGTLTLTSIRDQNNNYLYNFAMIRDITISKNNELALIESEKKFRTLAENSLDAIFRFNKVCKIIYVNSAGLILISLNEQQIIGKSFSELEIFDKTQSLMLENEIKDTIESSTTHYIKLEWNSPYGKVYLECKFNPELDENNNIVTVLGVATDITELMNKEDALIQAREKAEESDWLKTAFLANMSHEIRTPMNAILGFSQLLDSSNLLDEERREYIHFIHKRGNDLLNIINDILDISKIEANQIKLQYSTGDVNSMLLEIFALFSSIDEFVQRKPVTLMIGQKLENNSFILTDFTRLKQVLCNLIGNSFKFTNHGRIEFGCLIENEKNLLFYVKDTGIGIPVEKQAIVFERFRQGEDKYASRKFGGSGLGLSISKGIVELMDGKIWVESTVNVGSTFYFTIPYLPYNQIEIQSKIIAVPNYDWSNKLMLIVEDDIYNTKLIMKIISDTKANFILAPDGKTALELYNTNPNVDVILMDIQLPDISGFEVTKQILKINPNALIIAQTAYASEEDKKLCMDAGCCDFVSKPIIKNIFLNIINKYL